jgi:hypothetical protein
MDPKSLALLVTVILAFIGYFSTYINNLIVSRRKDYFDLINNRINNFYGPLYVYTQVSNTAFKALIKKLNKEEENPQLKGQLSEKEAKEWRLWLVNVFMPLNEWIEKIILENAYLIIEKDMPQCLLDYVTHLSGYKTVVAKLNSDDFSEDESIIDFPSDLIEYAEKSYSMLKEEQLRLMGKLGYEIK